MFVRTLATNISRISRRFLNDQGQYVGLGVARIANYLLFITFSRNFPFGLVVWQSHNWCLVFKSLPMINFLIDRESSKSF